jgi:eukaryotic-like serine/threonine-protein kinase
MTMQETIEVLLPTALAVLVALSAGVAVLAGRNVGAAATAAVAEPLRRIGPYLLLERLAAGSMGEVYRARHVGSGHVRALKLLPQSASARDRAQFDQEVRFGAQLSHPNTVSVLEHGRAEDGTRYFAMELVDGVTLQALIEREGPQPPERVIGILLQVAAALAEVHDKGLVHRDIKPDNILIGRDEGESDRVKLLDFGLVKHLSQGSDPSEGAEHVVGTPLYISPEALTSPQAVDGRSDLYGVGAVAHFLLSGAPVFTGRSVLEVCSQHLLVPPEPLSQLMGWVIGSDLERVVLDCLAKDPASRPASARELSRRLEGCSDHSGEGAARHRQAGAQLGLS